MAAILDCPDALGVELSSPVSSSAKPALRAGAVSSPASQPVPANTAAAVWLFLWVSVPITIIDCVPSIGCRLLGRTAGGQTSLGAKPRFYQVTAAILGQRRATKPMEVRPLG